MKPIDRRAILSTGAALSILFIFTLSGTAGAGFEPLDAPACATSIGVGNGNRAFITGCVEEEKGFGLQRFTGRSWEKMPLAGVRVAVSPEDAPWVVDRDAHIFTWDGVAFKALPGCAIDIGVGRREKAWIVGCKAAGRGGNQLYRYSGRSWKRMPGAAMKVAVSSSGKPWIIDREGKIARWDGRSFQPVPGCATEIGVGREDEAFIIGCHPAGDGGNEIYRWSGREWVIVPGSAVKIAVAPDGTPWVIDAKGAVYKWQKPARRSPITAPRARARAVRAGRVD